MRIAIWHNLPSGGGKRALWEMARGLRARGHEQLAWCATTTQRSYLPLAELMPETPLNLQFASRQAWHRLLPGRWGYGRHYAELERHCREAAAVIDAGSFDVCLVANCIMSAVPPIGRFLRTPTVHYCQEPARNLHEAGLEPERGRGLERGLRRAWRQWHRDREEEALAAMDRVLVNSRFSREQLLRAHARDAAVCYLGIDAEKFRVGLTKRERVVVGLGALQRHKDPAIVIEALATLTATNRPELIWIGNVTDKDYLAELTGLAALRGVRLTPRQLITDDELVATLGRAAMLIYTSRLEPFGFAPLEANACGTPVVAIAEGGVRETIVDGFNGVLVEERNARALGAAVARLLDDPVEAGRLGANGRQWVEERWGWDRCVAQLERELESVRKSESAVKPFPSHP